MKEPPPPRREPEATSGARPPGAAPPGPAAPHGVCVGGGLRPAVPPPPSLFGLPFSTGWGRVSPTRGSPPGPGCQGRGLGFSSQGRDVGDRAPI